MNASVHQSLKYDIMYCSKRVSNCRTAMQMVKRRLNKVT